MATTGSQGSTGRWTYASDGTGNPPVNAVWANSTTSISTGSGLSGGGTLAADRTIVNTGVLSVAAGTSMSVSPTTGNVIVAITGGLVGTKTYYVAATSGGAVSTKLTFVNGILTADT